MTKDECKAQLNLLNIKYYSIVDANVFKSNHGRVVFFRSTDTYIGGIFKPPITIIHDEQYAMTYEELIDLSIKELL